MCRVISTQQCVPHVMFHSGFSCIISWPPFKSVAWPCHFQTIKQPIYLFTYVVHQVQKYMWGHANLHSCQLQPQVSSQKAIHMLRSTVWGKMLTIVSGIPSLMTWYRTFCSLTPACEQLILLWITTQTACCIPAASAPAASIDACLQQTQTI